MADTGADLHLVKTLLALLMQSQPHDKRFAVLGIIKAHSLSSLILQSKLICIMVPRAATREQPDKRILANALMLCAEPDHLPSPLAATAAAASLRRASR